MKWKEFFLKAIVLKIIIISLLTIYTVFSYLGYMKSCAPYSSVDIHIMEDCTGTRIFLFILNPSLLIEPISHAYHLSEFIPVETMVVSSIIYYFILLSILFYFFMRKNRNRLPDTSSIERHGIKGKK